MPTKTYVLLDSMNTEAPIYQQTAEGQRIQLKKLPLYRPYLRVTFQDEKGVNKTIRYKASAVNAQGESVLDQREQIDKLKLEANEPFTTIERRDLEFKHGILVTNKKIAQDYLEAYPAFEGFKGTCDEVRDKHYKLLDLATESKFKNNDTKLRIKAANKVSEMELEDLQAMLIRLNGSFFETPTNVEDCQNSLWEFIDDAEEAGLNAVMKEDTTIDEDTKVLVGRLINEGLLSFNDLEGQVAKKQDDKWIGVREISATYSPEERMRYFIEFLNTADGKTLKNDLERDLLQDEGEEGVEKKKGGRPKKVQ